VRRSEERTRILDVIATASEPISPADIAEATGMKSGNVRFLLSKMATAGEVKTEGRGRYVIG
jgi:DNA-binding IclR family transcriptional regulator